MNRKTIKGALTLLKAVIFAGAIALFFAACPEPDDPPPPGDTTAPVFRREA